MCVSLCVYDSVSPSMSLCVFLCVRVSLCVSLCVSLRSCECVVVSLCVSLWFAWVLMFSLYLQLISVGVHGLLDICSCCAWASMICLIFAFVSQGF